MAILPTDDGVLELHPEAVGHHGVVLGQVLLPVPARLNQSGQVSCSVF